MDDTHKDNEPGGLEHHLNELLRKANASFAMPGMGAADDEEPQDTPTEPEADGDPLAPIREFSLKPREIKSYLDRFVIRQDDAKKVLSVAVCDHYNHVRRCLDNPASRSAEYSKHNIVLLGPTGVGKTYLMRCIARLIGVPFVKADATKFSETGYVGHDVEDLVRDLVKAADNNVDLAQYGIIYLDEVDKIAAQSTDGSKDVSGRGVQMNLLKLMEETDVSLFSQTDLLGQMQAIMDMQRGKAPGARTINTRHILFIVSGVFDKLGDRVERRVTRSRIGFGGGGGTARTTESYLRMLKTVDLVEYGFEPEFVGRLPVRVVCDPLSAGDLERILLESEDNILAQYRHDFDGYGITLSLDRSAIAAVAEHAHEEGTGARGLMTVLERTLRDHKFHLPSTQVSELTVDGHTIEAPGDALNSLLAEKRQAADAPLKAEAHNFASEFKDTHGITLQFTRDGLHALAEACAEKGCTVEAFFETALPNLVYGLQLIARNTGQSSFRITRKFIGDPEQELSRRIARSVKDT